MLRNRSRTYSMVKRLGIIICLALLGIGLYAFVLPVLWPLAEETSRTYEPLTTPLADYHFVRQDLNHIIYPLDQSKVMEPVFQTLDSLLFGNSGKLSIVHMGGSHVQAGTLGNRLREHFQHLGWNLDAERGLVFPYRLAHTNSQSSVKVDYTGDWKGCRCAHNKEHCDWGMTGYNVETDSDSATVKLWSIRTDSTTYLFNRVTLLHSIGEGSMQTELIDMRTDSLAVDSALQSTTYYFHEPVDTLRIRVLQDSTGSAHYSLRGILLENENAGITYHEIGVNGASTKSYLRCERMTAELKLLEPDLVIFGIGINDAYMTEERFDPEVFEQRYDSLISRFKSANPNVCFLFLTNNDSYYRKRYANRNALRVQRSMYRLSEKHGTAIWDLFEIMGGLNSIRSWEDAGLAKHDKIHFSPAGYMYQADLLFTAFRSAYGDHLAETDPLHHHLSTP